jgi:hypothetical protein
VKSSAKKKATRFWQGASALVGLLRSSRPARHAALAMILLGLMCFAALQFWGEVYGHVESQPEYRVAANDIEIPATPAWIHADVKAEAVRQGGLPSQLSILDPHLTQRLEQAFGLHAWVAHVDSVRTSYPAHIRVDLQYRRPIAMVEVYGGLLPIDIDGVLLPTEDFSPQEAQVYPRICGVHSSPLGPLGTRWDDPSVEAAAHLAEYLKSIWQTLSLHHLLVSLPQPESEVKDPQLAIVTRGGIAFRWGPATSVQTASPEIASQRIARLQQLARTFGSLDAVPPESRDLSGG